MRIVLVKRDAGSSGISCTVKMYPQNEEETRFLASLELNSPSDVKVRRES